MIIILPFKTLTVNHLYGNSFKHNRRYMKTAAKELKKEIAEIVENTEKDNFFREHPRKLNVIVEIHENWFTKDGNAKRTDIANREKFIIDSIFDTLNIDDKWIFQLTMKKIQSDTEQAVIIIEALC